MTKLDDLPAELRNVLYGQILPPPNTSGRMSNGLALFTVSKKFHFESTSYFYQHNAISVSAQSTITDTATILPPIPDQYLRYLRRLALWGTVSYSSATSTLKVANTIASLATIGADFEELHIHIRSPFSKLLNSRVDDSVLDTDHQVTIALRQLLYSGVAKVVRIELKNVWFAPDVAVTLQDQYADRLEFCTADNLNNDPRSLERPLTGRSTNGHLTALGLNDADMIDVGSCYGSPTSLSPLPSPIVSSSSCAFADLDAFCVVSYQLGADDDSMGKSESFAQADSTMQPFFDEDDIEEWQASTQESNESDFEDLEDIQEMEVDEDEEVDEISQDDMEAIFDNMEEIAHQVANEADVSYLTNFAPDLLLARHNLVHFG
jgi:hypothetical protein